MSLLEVLDEPTLIVSYVSVISAMKRLKIMYIKRLMNAHEIGLFGSFKEPR